MSCCGGGCGCKGKLSDFSEPFTEVVSRDAEILIYPVCTAPQQLELPLETQG